MTRALVLEIKGLLSDLLVSNKTNLRQRMLKDALDLMEELELNKKEIEKALKSEIDGKIEKVNAIVEKTLEEIDELEYSESE